MPNAIIRFKGKEYLVEDGMIVIEGKRFFDAKTVEILLTGHEISRRSAEEWYRSELEKAVRRNILNQDIENSLQELDRLQRKRNSLIECERCGIHFETDYPERMYDMKEYIGKCLCEECLKDYQYGNRFDFIASIKKPGDSSK